MRKLIPKFFIFQIIFFTLFLNFGNPVFVQGQECISEGGSEYCLLAPIPVTSEALSTGKTNARDYIPGIVSLVIAVAAVLAVVRIIFAGIKYMTTEAYGAKGEAKADIQGAVWGLLLAMSAYLILVTIDKKLVNFNLNIKQVETGGELGGEVGRVTDRETIDEAKESEGCPNCATVFPETNPSVRPVFGTMHPKPPGAGCKAGSEVCLVDSSLQRELQSLTRAIQSRAGYKEAQDPAKDFNNINWQVTEMYPPTVTHKHSCHNPNNEATGSCVDAALRNLNCADKESCGDIPFSTDAFKIQVFMEEASKLGLVVVYEVKSEARRDRLISELRRRGVSTPLVIAPKEENGTPAITGEHFSVYLNDRVYRAR